MAFCPECGKAVTPDEAACTSCGKQLRKEKTARAGRFHGTMMITAPAVKQQPPANINAEHPTEQTNVLASAAGMTSPRLGTPAAAKRSSRPPSAKQASNFVPKNPAATLGRPSSAALRATMVGTGAPHSKADRTHATMLGAALAPTTPRSKPPGAATSGAPSAKQRGDAPGGPVATSERPPIVRSTAAQASNSPSVRAVQSVPVSPSPDGPASAQPKAETARAQSAEARAQAEAETVPSPLPAAPHSKSPNAARMVQAIPEVVATVIDPAELLHNSPTVPREYLPGDPMAPQPSAASRRASQRPFAPEHPEEDQGNYVMLYWAVCVAVVAAVSALAFRLF